MIGSQGASLVLGFSASWLATRAFGQTDFGTLVAVIAAAQCINHMVFNWTAPAVMRFGCEEFVATGSVARTFWTRLALLSGGLLFIGATAAFWFGPLAGLLRIPDWSMLWVLAHLTTTSLWFHVQQTLQAAKLPRVQGFLVALERGQVVLGLLLAPELTKLVPLNILLTVYTASPLAVAAAGLWHLRHALAERPQIDRALLEKMIRFSLPLIPFSLLVYFTSQNLDLFFITRYLGVARLGVYFIAYQLAGAAMQLPTLAGSLLLPLMITYHHEKSSDKMDVFFSEYLPVLSLLWSVCCVIIAVTGGWLLPYVFGDPFRETSRLLWPMMATSALAGPILVAYGPASNAWSATYMNTVTAAAAAVVNVALNLILIPRFGLMGCAWASVGSCAVGALSWTGLIHKIVPSCSRARVLEAALPAVMGAALAASGWPNTTSLLAGIMTALIIGTMHRDVIPTLGKLLRIAREQWSAMRILQPAASVAGDPPRAA